MARSPQVILRERDDSAYAITSADTVLCVVGYATKGPIGVPTLTTSRTEFEQLFGPAPSDAPWSSLAVYRAFQQGNQILFYRVAEETGANMAVAAEKVILNGEDATSGYQEFSETDPVSFGAYTPQEVYDFQVTVDGGLTRDVYIPSPQTGDWSLTDIATAINTQITSDTSGFQEFEATTAPVVPGTQTEYRFQVSVDATNIATTGGTTSTEFSIFVDPGVSLSQIATAVSSALSAGTRGYHAWDNNATVYDETTTTSLSDTTAYDFNVNVDGAGIQDIQITTGTANTWEEIAALMESAINTAFGANSVTVRAYGSDGKLVVQSETEGATSQIALADDTQATDGTPLFAALNGSGTFDTAVDGSAGTAATGNYSVGVDSDTGRIRITSDSTGASSTVTISNPAAFGNALGTALTSILNANNGETAVTATAGVDTTTERVRITSDATGSSSTVAITAGTGADNEDLVAALGGTEPAVIGLDGVNTTSTDNILFRAKEKGSATNEITVIKSSSTNPVDGSTIHTVEVAYLDVVQETFDDISLEEDDSNFFVTVMNSDPDNGGSDWVEVEYDDIDADTTLTFPDGIYQLGVGVDEWQMADTLGDYDYREGTDGIPTSGGSTLFTTAFATTGELANTERFDYHVLITPDSGEQATQNAAIALAEYRKDFFYVADPPFGLNYNEVADWHNGQGFGRGSALNSSYAAIYWSWMKEFNTVSGEYVWSPPSVFIAAKYMEIDRRFGPWFAVAGDTRGKISGAADIETSPSLAQRDVIYGGLNAVNPIVNFAAKGIEIYGQKTLLRANSALNRINVRRMVIYVKKLIRRAMEGIIFEPHNPDSWARATNLINSILEPVRQANGLDDYRVTIDGTTNTQSLIAQGVMKGIIKLVPVGTIEVIDLTISIQSPGTTIEG